MGNLGRWAVAAAVVFVVLQCIRPGIPDSPAAAEIQAPAEIRQILQKNCYSCHSDQRRLAWFDQIVPAYWLVRHDVLTAREHLNFSTIGSKPAAVQKATLFEAVNMIQLGAMPLPSFRKLHPEARVTPEELATLKAYLDPWAVEENHAQQAARGGAGERSPGPARIALSSVSPERNGVPFDPDFENWKLISTTDRGDNNTFRFILGNEIAFKAAQSENISPWPDGSRFAKIAWQQQRGPDGLIYPGKFVQVELMVKDASAYRKTEGWGFGRWRGLDLQPYGANAGFVGECTTCHQPVRGNDYVYTLPITSAHSNGEERVNNRASLPAGLPAQPLEWNAITMYVDPDRHTTGTLFGNDLAIGGLRSQAEGTATPSYPKGAVLALVTWAQRDDPHWFGARIPDKPESVEFVEIGEHEKANSYRLFDGPALTESHSTEVAARTEFIVTLSPAILP